MKFIIKTFDQMTHDEIFQCFKLRVDVFVVEQKCYYPEIDELDNHPETLHLLLMKDNKLTGYARLLAPTSNNSTTCAIGRVIIAEGHRGYDLGQKLMQQAIAESQRAWPNLDIQISAQHHLQGFYQRLGFEITSGAYLEDGIPHIDMIYTSAH